MPDHTADQTTDQSPPAESSTAAAPRLPRRLVFRPPMTSLVVLAFLFVCESTVALALPWLWLLYLIPLAGALWVLRTRTVIDADTVVVRRVFTRRTLPWTGIASLRLRDRKWAAAVLADGTEVVLPEVRARHLPVLALITGGRISDPTEAPAESTESTEDEEKAPAAAGEAADAPVENAEKQETDQPV